ncbi:MAG TPA: hypothetical protein VHM02_10265 [Thermoanaerobaculia bacterium]|nr:hypothetical protein [Thermoanaerobaculia bacterium]
MRSEPHPEDTPWIGLVALYAPEFDPAAPLANLIEVEYYDTSPDPGAELTAYLVAGVVYRVVSSNLDADTHEYRGW